MRKLLLFTILSTTSATLALAQGKITFGNDSLHLVYMIPDTDRLLPADTSLAGQPVPAFGMLPSGRELAVDLWAGTSSTALLKVATTTLSSTPGIFGPVNISLAGFPGGAADFFQVQVYDQIAGSYAAAAAGTLLYYGESYVFTCTPNPGTGYNSIVNNGPLSDSGWLPGTYPIPGYGMGSIAVQMNPVPEPGVLALAGLGAAVWAGLRRRRQLTVF
jgi:hypothetical protein